MRLSLAAQFINAKEKYNAPINCTSMEAAPVTVTPWVDNTTSGANKVIIPANPRTILLEVISSFVFIIFSS
jgi:hypothetical protein